MHAPGAFSAAGQGLGAVWSLGTGSPCSGSPLLGALWVALLVSPALSLLALQEPTKGTTHPASAGHWELWYCPVTDHPTVSSKPELPMMAA